MFYRCNILKVEVRWKSHLTFFFCFICFVCSQMLIAPETWTFKLRMMPSWGISIYLSTAEKNSIGMPSFSFPGNKTFLTETPSLSGICLMQFEMWNAHFDCAGQGKECKLLSKRSLFPKNTINFQNWSRQPALNYK